MLMMAVSLFGGVLYILFPAASAPVPDLIWLLFMSCFSLCWSASYVTEGGSKQFHG